MAYNSNDGTTPKAEYASDYFIQRSDGRWVQNPDYSGPTPDNLSTLNNHYGWLNAQQEAAAAAPVVAPDPVYDTTQQTMLAAPETEAEALARVKSEYLDAPPGSGSMINDGGGGDPPPPAPTNTSSGTFYPGDGGGSTSDGTGAGISGDFLDPETRVKRYEDFINGGGTYDEWDMVNAQPKPVSRTMEAPDYDANIPDADQTFGQTDQSTVGTTDTTGVDSTTILGDTDYGINPITGEPFSHQDQVDFVNTGLYESNKNGIIDPDEWLQQNIALGNLDLIQDAIDAGSYGQDVMPESTVGTGGDVTDVDSTTILDDTNTTDKFILRPDGTWQVNPSYPGEITQRDKDHYGKLNDDLRNASLVSGTDLVDADVGDIVDGTVGSGTTAADDGVVDTTAIDDIPPFDPDAVSITGGPTDNTDFVTLGGSGNNTGVNSSTQDGVADTTLGTVSTDLDDANANVDLGVLSTVLGGVVDNTPGGDGGTGSGETDTGPTTTTQDGGTTQAPTPPVTGGPPPVIESDDKQDDPPLDVTVTTGQGEPTNTEGGEGDMPDGIIEKILSIPGSIVNNTIDSAANMDLGGILEGGINFYGQQEAADAAKEAAIYGIDANTALQDQVRSDLNPFKQAGIDAMGRYTDDSIIVKARENVDPLTGNIQAGQFGLSPDIDVYGGQQGTVFDGYKNLANLFTGSDFTQGSDPRQQVDADGNPILNKIQATTGGWDEFAQKNLISQGSDQWNQMINDEMTRRENMSAARGRLNTTQARDESMQGMLRAVGQMEGINQARTNQELGRRASDFGLSSGQRQQLFGEDFSVGSRGFGEDLATAQYKTQAAQDNRVSAMNEQLSEAVTQFDQQQTRREDIWNKLFAEEQTSFTNRLGANEQMFNQLLQEKQIDWNMLQQGDAQEFNKLMQLINMGQSSAAQTGSIAAGIQPSSANLYGQTANLQGAATGSAYEALGDMFGGMFSSPDLGTQIDNMHKNNPELF